MQKLIMAVAAVVSLTATLQGTVIVKMSGNDAHYHGPDAPEGGPWSYEVTGSFSHPDAVLQIDLAEEAPSDDITSILTWDFVDETSRRFYTDVNTGQVRAILHTDGDWNDGQPLTDENFADRVSRVEVSWFDPQFNPNGNFQTNLGIHPPSYEIVEIIPDIPEPTAFVILFGGVLVIGMTRRRVSGTPLLLVGVSVLAMIATADAQLPGPPPPTALDADTSIGFTWRPWEGSSGRVDGAMTLTYNKETGKAVLWAAGADTFHSAYLRNLNNDWLIDSEDDCFYDGPDYVCTSGVMTRVLGFEDRHPPNGGLYTHWEMPSEWGPGRNVNEILPAIWVGGATYGLIRGPDGLKLRENGFNVGTAPDGEVGPFLVTKDAPLRTPEPSAVVLFLIGMALILRKGRNQGTS